MGARILSVLRKNKYLNITSFFHDSCMTYHLAKSHRLPFDLVERDVVNPLKLIHLMCGNLSHEVYTYHIIFIDDFSCFMWIYPLKQNLEVYEIFCTF